LANIYEILYEHYHSGHAASYLVTNNSTADVTLVPHNNMGFWEGAWLQILEKYAKLQDTFL
jgi:hypothetical protein